ncbi:hypothetical protein ACQGAO_30960 [Rhodococcus sp. 1.20]
MIALLTHERDRMEERALNMMKNRDAIASYLDEVIDIANEGSAATPQPLPARTDNATDNTAMSAIAS